MLRRPQHKITSPDPEYEVKKVIEDVRDHLKPSEVFYFAAEFTVSWLPILKAMWSPKGQQVMIATPGQPNTHYGLGAVNYHTGAMLVLGRPTSGDARSLNCCRRSSISTRTRRCMSLGTTPPPTKMTRSRRSSVGRLAGCCSCTCRLTALAYPGGNALAALSPESNALRIVREYQGRHCGNPGHCLCPACVQLAPRQTVGLRRVPNDPRLKAARTSIRLG